MLHELKNIVNEAVANQQKGLKSVLATVVYLEGSSYRKPGVRMLICENNNMIGAVSGGCVEKEVLNQAQSVFKDEKSKVMTYDGRYRLGCEGILYILIEPFNVSEELLEAFNYTLNARQESTITSYYKKEDIAIGSFGSVFQSGDNQFFTFSEDFNQNESGDLQVFRQTLQPCFKLLIIGAEHDAVRLCVMASLLGWEVDIITSIKDPKLISDFPGAKSVTGHTPETIDVQIDSETAIVLMTHSYAQDLKYLLRLESLNPKYLGVLGSIKRRNQLLSELIEFAPNVTEDFLDSIYSPAGLDLGAITPEEIAMSILSEILSVTRQTNPVSLRIITGKIHA